MGIPFKWSIRISRVSRWVITIHAPSESVFRDCNLHFVFRIVVESKVSNYRNNSTVDNLVWLIIFFWSYVCFTCREMDVGPKNSFFLIVDWEWIASSCKIFSSKYLPVAEYFSFRRTVFCLQLWGVQSCQMWKCFAPRYILFQYHCNDLSWCCLDFFE